LEAVKALLSFARVEQKVGRDQETITGNGTGVKFGLGEAPLTPQTSDADESDEEKERATTSMGLFKNRDHVVPQQLQLKPLKDIKNEPFQPRASVIMLAHKDGTFEPAASENKKKGPEFGYNWKKRALIALEPRKELPPPEQPPSRKTDGSEMTSGHRDKNIPMTGGVVVHGGDVIHEMGSCIATSTRAPVFSSEPPNLQSNANSKCPF
jgi:hypothetical protein